MSVIYLDILFLCNLTFDLLSVYITSHFVDTKLHPFRCFLGCVLGSLAGIWLVVWCANGVLFLISALLTLFLMVHLSFSPKSVGAFFRLSVVLLFCLFLTGAVAYYFLRWAVLTFGISENADGDAKALLFSVISVLSGGLLSLSSKAIRRQNQKKTVVAKIKWEKNTAKCACLVDSGNLLKDPIDGRPVLLLPKNVAEALFQNREIITAMTDKEGYGGIARIPQVYQNRLRIVPYHTINQGGVLLCVIPHQLLVENMEKNALVGICPIESREKMGICPQTLLS